MRLDYLDRDIADVEWSSDDYAEELSFSTEKVSRSRQDYFSKEDY